MVSLLNHLTELALAIFQNCFKLHSPNRPVKSCVTIFIRGISSKHHRISRLDAHFNIAG